MSLILKTAKDDEGRRLDRVLRKFLAKNEPEITLSAIHRMFRKGKILVNGIVAKSDARVLKDQMIELKGTTVSQTGLKKRISPKNTDKLDSLFNILYEKGSLLALNKSPGLIVHGKASLEEQVSAYLEDKVPASLSFKPGPLHRLDKESSGIIVFSTGINGAQYFSRLMREQKVHKKYLAIVDSNFLKDEDWEDQLIRDNEKKKTHTGMGKIAISSVKALANENGRSLISVEIKTGRTHQIRAQASSRGFPLSGDTKYGGKSIPGESRFFLHAMSLEFTAEDGEMVLINAPLPKSFSDAIEKYFPVNVLRITEDFPELQLLSDSSQQ